MTKNQEMIWEKGRDIWERLRNRHLFVTGGTGYFGKSLLDLVRVFNKEKGISLKITILTRDQNSFRDRWPELCDFPNIQFQDGDISNFKFLHTDIDYVLHFATPASATLNWEDPVKMFDTIVNGTRHTLEYARFCSAKGMLLASSGAVYGRQPTEMYRIHEAYTGAPLTNSKTSAYGEGKRVAELLGNIYSEQYGFDHKVARCFAFVGPYLDFNGTYAIGNFIRDALDGSDIRIKGDGRAVRSYMYSNDLILWLLKILLDGKNKASYNVGSDISYSIKQVAEHVGSVLNPNLKVTVGSQTTASVSAERYIPSIDLAKNELGLEVWTSFEDAIRLTSEAYLNLKASQKNR